MPEFKIEVPIDVKNKGGTSGAGGGLGVGKLATGVAAGTLASKALATVMEGVMKIMEPLVNVLKALFIVVFMPLMPLIMSLTEAVVGVIDGLLKLFSGEIDFVEFVKQFIGPAILAVAGALWDFIVMIAKAAIQIGNDIGQWIYDSIIVPMADAITGAMNWIADKITEGVLWVINALQTGLSFFATLGSDIWNFILSGLQFIADIGVKIWDFFLSGLSFISDLGAKIWAFISNALSGLGSFISGIFGGHRAEGGPVASGSSYIVGEQGPELFTPSTSGNITPNGGSGGDSITINLSNNNFQSESDMRRMVDMISRELQSRSNRSFS